MGFGSIMQAWDGVSGAGKAWVEGLGAAVVTAGGDAMIQELTSGGLSLDALDWKQIAAAAALAGVIYVRANLQGLLRYPDGSPVHVDPAPPPHG